MLKILSEVESLKRIRDDRLSIGRFGDGEFQLMGGNKIEFQKRNLSLRMLLRQAFTDLSMPNYVVGIPTLLMQTEDPISNIWRESIKAGDIHRLLQLERAYHSAFISRPDSLGPEAADAEPDIWNLWRDIVRGRRIVLVQSKDVGVNQEKFLAEATSIKLVKAPCAHAFTQYDYLKEQVGEHDAESLFLISLGPTATVLAYELAAVGWQGIDIGQLWKFIEFHLTGRSTPDKATLRSIGFVPQD